MSSISKSESVDSASLSSLNISTDTTNNNKSQFKYNDNSLVIDALQPPYRFQLDYVEHDEHESNDNSTGRDQMIKIVIVNNL